MERNIHIPKLQYEIIKPRDKEKFFIFKKNVRNSAKKKISIRLIYKYFNESLSVKSPELLKNATINTSEIKQLIRVVFISVDNPIIKRGNKQNIIKNSGDIFISRSVEKNINNDEQTTTVNSFLKFSRIKHQFDT